MFIKDNAPQPGHVGVKGSRSQGHVKVVDARKMHMNMNTVPYIDQTIKAMFKVADTGYI